MHSEGLRESALEKTTSEEGCRRVKAGYEFHGQDVKISFQHKSASN